MNNTPQLLLSLPRTMAEQIQECEPATAARSFATYDPPNSRLGSGGGSAYVLHQASSAEQPAGCSDLDQWISEGRRIVVHGGGESRRLPAYAAVSKLFIPIPALRWSRGQRLGQTLLDLNEPFLRQAFEQSAPSARVMIASGDVLLRAPKPIRQLPEADVVLLGMWAAPEVAQHYGVMFCDRRDPQQLLTFLQKPNPDEIRERSRNTAFLIDIGVWLLSRRAIQCLMSQCGWDEGQARFRQSDLPDRYDLYGEWALHLGHQPQIHERNVSALSCAVAPIPNGEFYHFGTTRDVIESTYALQNVIQDQTVLGPVPSLAQPKQFIQDSDVGVPIRRQENDALWIENSHIPSSWKIAKRHMLTGVPCNDWAINLPEGVCLDFVPVGDNDIAIRAYGYSDPFRGPLGNARTLWQERPAAEWFSDRGFDCEEARIAMDSDLQQAAIFPVLRLEECTGSFVQWLIDPLASPITRSGDNCNRHREKWLACRKLSAHTLSQHANLQRLVDQRLAFRRSILPLMARHAGRSVLYTLDLADVASIYAPSNASLPPVADEENDLMLAVHDHMFRSEVLKQRQDESWREEEEASFQLLKRAIVSPYENKPVTPVCRLGEDQIVWARSPARVDLAGGWTDTPPYCIEQGGSVVNIALDLNGQPPVQVFVRRSEQRTITIRSIDLGISETITTYEELGSYRGLGSGFSVAKAALALCGFHPTFHGGKYDSLQEQLDSFDGGVDLSMLAAIPKGSGLGTSSILAGTVLGALSELCELGWDIRALAARVSAIEQMLGSGGGWQDQFGGLLQGAKLIETQPGITQQALIRWLPADFFHSPELKARALLYYTGITRVAHDVLGEIVRGMFLNDPARLTVLNSIRANSKVCSEAVQRFDLPAFAHSIRTSWELNQALDCGTNPPEVAAVVDLVAPHLSAFKLAGAGGGGFLYMLAKDEEQAQRVRRLLEENPTNQRARFVDMTISLTGLQVTRS
jgi:fucokinase / fucose-1-phosphate guanylyltransferase